MGFGEQVTQEGGLLMILSDLSTAAVAAAILLVARAGWAAPVLQPIDGEAPAGTVEIQGVSAGPFQPDWWQAGTLNWNFDSRAPLIEPKQGRCRNIYAPTVVRDGDKWRIFYGAWDGVETGNDRIYSTWTEDFLSFHDRHMVIDHGVYIHVCNCCAIGLPSGEWRMMCTAYPHREGGLNRPAAFFSPDGLTWNGALPHVAAYTDLATIAGYPNWENSDINGMNAILFEDGTYRLYFADFRNFTQIHRAGSEDFRTFTYEGPVLDGACAVNDVKRFDVAGQSWYLMAMHMNGDQMWYALSRDGMAFEPRKLLTRNQSAADRYMVAVGIVTDGVTVYGFLYGAGAEPHLAANRIFAKWLQKKVVLHTHGGDWAEAEALGPDMQRLRVPEGVTTGSFEVFAEDGRTSLGAAADVALRSGGRYRIVQE
jgi:hypothetical protein